MLLDFLGGGSWGRQGLTQYPMLAWNSSTNTQKFRLHFIFNPLNASIGGYLSFFSLPPSLRFFLSFEIRPDYGARICLRLVTSAFWVLGLYTLPPYPGRLTFDIHKVDLPPPLIVLGMKSGVCHILVTFYLWARPQSSFYLFESPHSRLVLSTICDLAVLKLAVPCFSNRSGWDLSLCLQAWL